MSRLEVSQAPEPVALLYNPDRWVKLSIGRQTVGPMGVMPIPAANVDEPVIKKFLQQGKLVRLNTGVQIIPHGKLLLKIFEDKGRRGSIVVSRTYAHGDIFLAATVLESLVKEYPHNNVIFHTTEKMEPLVRHHPDVQIITGDEALKEALRTAGVFLNLDDIPEKFEEHNPGAGLNRIEIFHDYVGMTPESLRPAYYISRSEIDSAAKHLSRFDKPFLAISPSTMRKEKSWRPIKWKELANSLAQRSQGTIFVFDSVDILGCKHNRIIPLINRSFRAAGALAWHMNIMITQDSLWSHFAAALGVPQILLASCTDGALLSRGYGKVMVIQRDWDCVPCWYRMLRSGCVYGNYPECLDDVTVSEVIAKALEVCDG